MTTPIVNREDPPPVTVGSAPTPSVAKPSGGGRGKTAEQLKEEEFFKNHTKEVKKHFKLLADIFRNNCLK